MRVFLDENSYDDYDELHSDFEDRIKIVGRVGNILAVIYTEREDRNRIISARLATKKEEARYYEHMSNFIKNIPPLTEEQIAEIEALSKMSDDEIDLSDIPEITDEEWRTRFKPTRLRRKSLKNIAS